MIHALVAGIVFCAWTTSIEAVQVKATARDQQTETAKGDYTFVHDGHCNGGFISGSNTRQVSIGACASQCRNRIQCAYFAFDSVSASGTNCALYEAGARCPDDARYPNYNSYRMEDLESNQQCNSRDGQRTVHLGADHPDGNDRSGYTCSGGSDNHACISPYELTWKVCKSCSGTRIPGTSRTYLTRQERNQCRKIARNGRKAAPRSLKVSCHGTAQNEGCASPWIHPVGGGGHIQWSPDQNQVCPCVKKFAADCKDLNCLLDKVAKCPKVCSDVKGRLKNARENALIEENEDGNELKDRASVLVDARGKTFRNASASIMSLDDSMTGKCAV